MIPLLLLAAGLVTLAIGWALIRSLGPRGRAGRILAATSIVPIAEARRLAETGTARYIGVQGRIDSEDEFENEHHQPLVYRRSRLEAAQGRGWRPLDDHTQVVRFEVAEGLDRILVDGEALADGLIVVLRQSEGTAGEIPDRVPADLPADTPVRLLVEQVSSVDHAVVMGVPELDGAGEPILRPGTGRPLVLTNLERPEAMRLIAVDHRQRTLAATALLAAGLVTISAGVLAGVVDAIL